MSEQPIRVIATWRDSVGNTYEWPMATVDNRRERVLARIHRFQMGCDESTLEIREA